MISNRLTSLAVLLQAVGYVVSPSMRGECSHQGTNSSLRKLRACNENETNTEVLIDYADDPYPYIYYELFNTNGTLVDEVEDYPNSSEGDTFYNKEYCLDSTKCFVIFFPEELGEYDWDLEEFTSHYNYEIKFNEETEKGKTDGVKFIKFGNCPSPCDKEEAELLIQTVGYDSKFTIYDNTGVIAEEEFEAIDYSLWTYFEKSVCLDPSGCYTGVVKGRYFNVNYNGSLVTQGYQSELLNVGGGCINTFSQQRL